MLTEEKLKIYYDQDINRDILLNKKIAIIGYGSQGRPHALNLRDSGANVRIALRQESSKIEQAKSDNIKIMAIPEAVKWADVVVMMLPDETHAEVYEKHLKNNLRSGAYMIFAHGFSVHYGEIIPKEDMNILLVSPKGIGPKVRANYENGGGVAALVAVHQDVSGDSKQVALAYAGLIGSGRAGILETTFKNETEIDLFGEQAVLCGGLSSLVKAAFDTLVEAGYPPEIAYFDCFHELKLIIDMLFQNGITETREKISNTARYGDVTRGPKIISERSRQVMREILSDIQSGKFAQEWIEENKNGKPLLTKLTNDDRDIEIEKVGRELRSRMKLF